mmetsp:Transcript_42640/g.114094  ORF Transcript_42640/g.114094 Transcript_42640/m.114094 type:complete len:232 (-) Transcript_42640:5597-6292(-)
MHALERRVIRRYRLVAPLRLPRDGASHVLYDVSQPHAVEEKVEREALLTETNPRLSRSLMHTLLHHPEQALVLEPPLERTPPRHSAVRRLQLFHREFLLETERWAAPGGFLCDRVEIVRTPCLGFELSEAIAHGKPCVVKLELDTDPGPGGVEELARRRQHRQHIRSVRVRWARPRRQLASLVHLLPVVRGPGLLKVLDYIHYLLAVLCVEPVPRLRLGITPALRRLLVRH